jgi:EAL domain-containing protein (putative c-di-GMP-specific phosphodiesterase class I)
MYPTDGTDMQTLTKNADMAMYLAKEDGKNGFRFFTKGNKAQSIERLTLESALRRALERDQFSLHYQPKVDLASGQITGVEALLRWTHPLRGAIPPDVFIPLAEETGLILPIGMIVLRQACRQMQLWKQQHKCMTDLDLSVNLSTRQLLDPGLATQLSQILEETGLDARNLHLELTESVLMEDADSCVRVLSCLKELGVGLKIDDFGTGYSSLSYLHRLPIDTLKIDRAFIVNMEKEESLTIIKAIVAMAGNLNMKIVAEGVETARHLLELRRLGCQYGQGYYFSQPLPAAAAGKLIEEAARECGRSVLNVQQDLAALQEHMRQLPDSDVPGAKLPGKTVLSAA